ncbi:fluoride efflux transporter CrcB [Brumicola pallidula]|jgi:CrcB protein|nr:fluoride efflux transporter CrcB [Glaciecola pallidula]
MQTFQIYLFVAIGGAIGASMRYFVLQLATNLLGKSFPFGTLAVNVLGSFVLGLVYAFLQQDNGENTGLRVLVGFGLIGAFTTFSTFSLDTVLLIQQGELIKAALNVFFNVTVCLISVWLAFLIYQRIM